MMLKAWKNDGTKTRSPSSIHWGLSCVQRGSRLSRFGSFCGSSGCRRSLVWRRSVTTEVYASRSMPPPPCSLGVMSSSVGV
jgi:hypothetical protein